jgi:hypothetical protein
MADKEFQLDPVKLDLANVRGTNNRLTENRGLGDFTLRKPWLDENLPPPPAGGPPDWINPNPYVKRQTTRWEKILDFLGPKSKEPSKTQTFQDEKRGLDDWKGKPPLPGPQPRSIDSPGINF